MENERAKETTAIVTGLGLAGLALFCGLSLYSHQPADVMDYEASSTGVDNFCGLIGATVAHHLLCLYGMGAWVIVTSLFVFGMMICAARSLAGTLLRGAGTVLMVALICAWAGTLALDPSKAVSSSYPAGPGGLLGGRYLAPPLVDYFGPVGVYLVLVTVGVLAGLLIAQNLTECALSLVGRGTGSLVKLGWESVKGRLQEPVVPTPTLQPLVATPSGRFMPVNQNGAIQHDRVAIEPAASPVTRKLKAPLPDSDARDIAKELDEALESKKRSLPKLPKVEAQEESKQGPVVDGAQVRREEALRQVEAAEKDRLKREKEAKEASVKAEKEMHEREKLENLDKERKAKEREKEAAKQKFIASMQDKKKAVEPAAEEEEDALALALPKPKLPDDYVLPDYKDLEAKDIEIAISSEQLKERGTKLIETLWEFKIGSALKGIHHGPAVTMFELSLDPGIKVQRVIALQDNLAMAMKAENGVRIIAPIPGRDTIGIEIPNSEDYVVRMRPVLESPNFRNGNWTLPLILGRDATGNPLVTDLTRMPHLLIAGTTGSGKSVCVNSIILSLMILRRPHEVKLILVDPKQVEMTDFKGIPHLLCPVVSDMKLAAGVLTWAVQKMEERYERMQKVGVRNISTFNKLTTEERLARLPQDEPQEHYVDPLAYIVIIVDEFADLMMTSGKEIEQAIARLAQKARAAGIHVILATQRPSADVVTGLIKSNLPCRICFQVKSKIDSRIVLDQGGADKLAGKGDMLFIPPGSSQLVRAKGVYIADHEIKAVVDCCKKQAQPIYSDEIERVATANTGEDGTHDPAEALPMDEKFEDGVECFLSMGRASTSLLQRRMGLGYTRAAKLCDQMEQRGIVGPDRGAKGRELLITQESWESYKRGKMADTNHAATWGDRKSKTDESSTTTESLPAPIAALDAVDGTRGDEDGDRSDSGEDGRAKVDLGMLRQLETKDSASVAD